MSLSNNLRKFVNRFSRSTATGRHLARRRLPGVRLQCEALEDRRVLAVGDVLQTFLNPTPAANDQFGGAVAGVGNNVLVGAPFDDAVVGPFFVENSGAAYLLDGSTGAGY